MNPVWFPSAQELRRATAARDNTDWTPEQAARQLNIPVDWMRRFYSEKSIANELAGRARA